MFNLIMDDAIHFLDKLPKESVDLVITDPPYESLEKYRHIGTTTRLKKEWFPIFPNKRFREFFLNIYHVLKNNSHFYMFSDQETMRYIITVAECIGFIFWKPLVWDKINIGMGYHYRSKYEFILFFEKGKRKLNNLSIPDILRYKRIYNKYPTEKPVDLLKVLVEQSSSKNQLVCDPFMGSGSVGEAALLLNRNFIGCDILEKSLNLTMNRLISLENDIERRNNV